MSPDGSAAAAPSVDGDAQAGLEGPWSIVPGGVAFAPAEFRTAPCRRHEPQSRRRKGDQMSHSSPRQLKSVGCILRDHFPDPIVSQSKLKQRSGSGSAVNNPTKHSASHRNPEFAVPFGQDRLVPIFGNQTIQFRTGAGMLESLGMHTGGKSAVGSSGFSNGHPPTPLVERTPRRLI